MSRNSTICSLGWPRLKHPNISQSYTTTSTDPGLFDRGKGITRVCSLWCHVGSGLGWVKAGCRISMVVWNHENIKFLHQNLPVSMGSINAGITTIIAKISSFHCTEKLTKNYGERFRKKCGNVTPDVIAW